jgi:hypothetical protein
MAKEPIYKYRKYDIASDDYVYSTRYATMGQINRIEAEAIGPTVKVVDSKHLTDGWTKKNFDPSKED